MTAQDLLEQLQKAGVHLEVGAGVLRYRAPDGAMTAELRAALSEHKDGVLELLMAAAPQPASTPLDREARQRLVQGEFRALFARLNAVRPGGWPEGSHRKLAEEAPEVRRQVHEAERLMNAEASKFIRGDVTDARTFVSALHGYQSLWERAVSLLELLAGPAKCMDCGTEDATVYLRLDDGRRYCTTCIRGRPASSAASAAPSAPLAQRARAR
jgi:hypothetical protein